MITLLRIKLRRAKGGECFLKNNTLITIIVAVMFAGLGFYAGQKYQQNKTQTTLGGRTFQGSNHATTNGTNRPVSGNIISADSSSITVKMADGSSKIVLFSDKTVIGKMATGSAGDLKTGERISAFGTTNTDGSITAQNIQINPEGGFGNRITSPTPTP